MPSSVTEMLPSLYTHKESVHGARRNGAQRHLPVLVEQREGLAKFLDGLLGQVYGTAGHGGWGLGRACFSTGDGARGRKKRWGRCAEVNGEAKGALQICSKDGL